MLHTVVNRQMLCGARAVGGVALIVWLGLSPSGRAQQSGVAVDNGGGGLVMPTDEAPSGPLPEPAKSRSVRVITADAESTPSEQLWQNAFVAYKNGDYQAAQVKLKKLLEENPKDAKAKLLQGRVLMARRQYDEAVEAILTAIEEDPAAVPRAQLYLGETLLAQHKVMEARGAFAAQLKTEPKNKDALLLYAMCEAELRNLQEARDAALQLDQMDAIHPGHYFANAAIAQATGKTEKATENLDAARTTYGSNTWARYMKYYLQVFPPGKAKGNSAGNAPAP